METGQNPQPIKEEYRKRCHDLIDEAQSLDTLRSIYTVLLVKTGREKTAETAEK